MTFLRRAGAGTDRAGARVVWTMSEGGRGRRWREVGAVDGVVVSSLLLETGPDGRFLHTELSTASGLLTLHPEPDGSLHGNVVDGSGVHHVVGLDWDADGAFVLEGSAIAVAAAVHLLRFRVGGGGAARWPAVLVGLDLGLRVDHVSVERAGERSWRFDDAEPVELDDDGLPRLRDGGAWPLEVE